MNTSAERFLDESRTLQRAVQAAAQVPAQVPGPDVDGAFERVELQRLGFLARADGAVLHKTMPAPVLAWACDADAWARGLVLRVPLRFSGRPTGAMPREWVTQLRRQVAAGPGVLPASHAAMAVPARALQEL